MHRSRWAIGLGAGALALAATAWGLARAVDDWRAQAELASARREVAAGQFATARSRLERLKARQPGWNEVDYLRGACAEGEGDLVAALAAWSRIPAGSPYAGRAASLRANAALAS